MRTIVISIQVPDGVDVKVTNGGQPSYSGGGSDRPFVARGTPDYPDVECSVCGRNEWRLIPAGVSRTKTNADGSPKRFNAFYVCSTKDCDGKPGAPTYAEVGDLPF